MYIFIKYSTSSLYSIKNFRKSQYVFESIRTRNSLPFQNGKREIYHNVILI